jgi:hypothetical protein
MTREKRRKPSPQAPAARPVQDSVADDTLNIVATGLLHVAWYYSIPVKLSMGSADGIATIARSRHDVARHRNRAAGRGRAQVPIEIALPPMSVARTAE